MESSKFKVGDKVVLRDDEETRLFLTYLEQSGASIPRTPLTVEKVWFDDGKEDDCEPGHMISFEEDIIPGFGVGLSEDYFDYVS
tara:strand:+ start:935 stop:1186 length:252 start_codon:yes stop_codon:yes gene_type:complete